MKPDFNVEERISIEKDRREICQIINEMAECLPKEDPEKGKSIPIQLGINQDLSYISNMSRIQ